jgi:hypothetical protein
VEIAGERDRAGVGGKLGVDEVGKGHRRVRIRVREPEEWKVLPPVAREE